MTRRFRPQLGRGDQQDQNLLALQGVLDDVAQELEASATGPQTMAWLYVTLSSGSPTTLARGNATVGEVAAGYVEITLDAPGADAWLRLDNQAANTDAYRLVSRDSQVLQIRAYDAAGVGRDMMVGTHSFSLEVRQ